MPRPYVQPLLSSMTSKVRESLTLAQEAVGFHEKRRGEMRPVAQSKVYLITQLAFLQLFLAWEDFLEQTFICYMCRGKTGSGYSPELRVRAQNLDHALEILKGPRQYVEWVDGHEIQDRAKTFFQGGEPYYSAIVGAITQLNEMRKIRNRIAHRSKSSEQQFEELGRQLLGYKPKGLTPGLLLRTKLPAPQAREVKKGLQAMGVKKSRSAPTFLDGYGNLLLILGSMIVP